MDIKSAASRPARVAPAANFTGPVFQDVLARAEAPSKTNATMVTFAPGARTVWHTHDMRQVLVVTLGLGIIQVKGEKARTMQPGDVVSVPPGVVHWHGASQNSVFAHMSILESTPDGTDWGEKVTDADYQKANADIGAPTAA
jgi:quercetin dioxygenase-like cupin family protein